MWRLRFCVWLVTRTFWRTDLRGRILVKMSCWSLKPGQTVGVTGLDQVFELVIQLRKKAGKRQIENPRVGLAQIMGGNKEGDTRACAVHIFVNDYQ